MRISVHQIGTRGCQWVVHLLLGCVLFTATGSAQERGSAPCSPFPEFLGLIAFDQQSPPRAEGQGTQPSGAQTPGEQSESAKPAAQSTPPPQPKRILGVMPNFRAVSAGTIPPPPTPKQAFVIATKNSFDYSSFIFVGITSAFAEWTNAHPQLGQGMAGYEDIIGADL